MVGPAAPRNDTNDTHNSEDISPEATRSILPSILQKNVSSSSEDSAHALTRPNGSASVIANAIPDFKDLERTVSSVLQQQQQAQGQRGSVAMQSAPYASMVGVVLIGVGLMTWLNGWQRGDR